MKDTKYVLLLTLLVCSLAVSIYLLVTVETLAGRVDDMDAALKLYGLGSETAASAYGQWEKTSKSFKENLDPKEGEDPPDFEDEFSFRWLVRMEILRSRSRPLSRDQAQEMLRLIRAMKKKSGGFKQVTAELERELRGLDDVLTDEQKKLAISVSGESKEYRAAKDKTALAAQGVKIVKELEKTLEAVE